jgi:hypothetical protein
MAKCKAQNKSKIKIFQTKAYFDICALNLFWILCFGIWI